MSISPIFSQFFADNADQRGILCDREIADLCIGRNMITPFIDHKVKADGMPSYGLSHFGYDIRLGRNFIGLRGGNDYPDQQTELRSIDTAKLDEVEYVKFAADRDLPFTLAPLEFVLGESVEDFALPADIFGILTNKSTLARVGLSQVSTTLEPGWSGKLTLELFNCHSRRGMALYPGMGIAQIVFFRGKPPMNTYGDTGTYQRQVGVTPAKVAV